MKKTLSQNLRFAFCCLLVLAVFTGSGWAQTSTFTYQGSLTIGGTVANGSYDLQFKLYDQLTGGALQGSPSTVAVSSVAVTGGVFSVDLNFGAAAFPGAARYLEISVRPAGSGSFTTLSPRQQLTSTPYAIRSLSAASADTATTATTATTAISATSATTATNFTGSLTGDVTGTQSATVVSLVGGVTASNVASGATAANNATSANTPSTIVKRDASGNFSAGAITGNIVNATTQFNLNGNRILSSPGTGNLFAGTNTGATNSTGSNVTLIGNGADVGAGNLSYATALGAGATVSANNTVALGRAADTVLVPGNLTVNGTITGTVNANVASATNFTGSLNGDVTGTQSATVVSTVGGVTASNVASGATLANNATDANTANAIVKRDASGNFTAGTIAASEFSGSGANLTNLNASNITSGTLADARLSSNVAKLNTAQTFTANQTVNANLIQSGTLVQFTPTDGFVAKGSFGSGSVPTTGGGTRMMWYPGKQAFRAGFVDGAQWDDANIGAASVAIGQNITASGVTSVALGANSTASANVSVAFGSNATASGNNSTALGSYASTNAKPGSFVYGDSSTTSSLSASANNQFSVRAAGGLRLFASSDTSDETKPGVFISGTTGNTQINGNLTVSGAISGTVSGSSITNLSASNITSGTLSDSLLSSNVATLSGDQTFTGGKIFSSVNGLLATGTFNTGTIPATGAGQRMMWYPKKIAFRAGSVTSSEWDDANIGLLSVAMGNSTKASGNASFAMGNQSTASATASVALGSSTTASGLSSIALGSNTTASGARTTALGYFASTNGNDGSFVYGDNSTTTLLNATATNQFNVRAAGGLRLFASSDTSDETKPGVFISGTTGNTQINGNLTVSGTISGGSITNLNAGNISSGVLGIANGGTGSSTQNFVDLSSNQVSIGGNKTFTGTVTASSFSGSGSSLANLNATNITSGTLSDSLLSSNVAMLGGDQTFTGNKIFAGANGLLATGSLGSGSILATGKGVRMMWYPNKAAFRAGYLTDNTSSAYWDDANIGSGSAAFGLNTLASGDDSFAIGYYAKATGSESAAIGFFATATGSAAIALGQCGATSSNAVCLGGGTASGSRSVSMGTSTTASGDNSTAMGIQASTNGMKGSFVYGDASSAGNTMSATATNQFNVRAAGGYRFFASSDTSDTTKPGLFISGTTGNTQINGNLTVSGSISGTFSGSGSSLTGLNAGNITSGVLAIANGGTGSSTQNFVDLSSNQTSIGGNKTFTGTVTAATFSGSGSNLTGLNAGNITSGVLGIANGGTGSSTQNFVDLSSNQTSIGGNKTFTGTVTASTFSGSGSSLTGLNAGNISSGTLADARLSSNIPLLNAANTFTANQTVNANLIQSGTLAQFTATDGFVAKGSFNSGSIPATGAGARMMWYPGAAAFRAGYVAGTQWDTPGDYSTAFGYNARANGYAAFAAGNAPNASGDDSVAIGDGATASGNNSVAIGTTATASQLGAVALGHEITSSGHYSTAMGNFASANGKNGGFIYGDLSTTSDISAIVDNQFIVRAQQFWFGTNNNVTSTSGRFLETSTGAYLTTGGTWTNSSSRALKTNFATVNPRDVLQKVMQLPIQTWNYKAEDARVRHIGAISQDFNRLFGFGDSAETISTVDADGVALAAIQGLHEELKDRDARLEQQQQELGQLKQQVKQQQALIDGLRKLLCAQNPQAEVCQK